MAQNNKIPTTQRAYTLRLRGSDSQDASWHEALWKTHEAVNKGAKVFGDWLLTMRGGLCHTLADEPPISEEIIYKEWEALKKESKKKKTSEPGRDTAKETAEFKRQGRIRDKRILLALSWLSVESEKGAPNSHRSDWNAVDALKNILESRGIADKEIQSWLNDCKSSLSANIREDAVWVDRSKAFDEAVKQIGNSFGRDKIWDFLEPFFSSRNAYLAPIKETGNEDDEISSGAGDEKAKNLVQKAGQWLSSRFGTGKGANFTKMSEVYKEIAEWSAKPDLTGSATIESMAIALSNFKPASNDLKGVRDLISGPGYKSATRNILSKINDNTVVTQDDLDKLKKTAKKDFDTCGKKTGNKGQRPYAERILDEVKSACGFMYLQLGGPARHAEFVVMLDHAARRVSLAHTWIKRAEAERRQFEEDADKINRVPADVKNWLDRFCESRSLETGSIEAYRIRRRAVDGWKDVVKEWSKSDCKTEADRIAGARSLQDDKEIKKFGDIQLFEALASDDAVCVWRINDKADPQPLLDYVAATDAEAKQHRFKVPAYRHPDALLHPVFCDFGNSRWDISFAMHEAAKKGKKLVDKHALSMKLWTGSEVKDVGMRWQSKLLDEDLPLPVNVPNDSGKTMTITRASRLSRAAADAPKESAVNIAGLFEQKDWNGRLQAPRTQLEELSKYVEKHGWTDRARSMRYHIRWLITFSAKLQPMGPWVDFAPKNNLKPNPRYLPHSEENKKRSGMSRLILSRLSRLRVLSVDLGHRYAAACAVWETISSEQMRAACAAAGLEPPKENVLYLHLKSPEGKKTTIYRRIGPDTLNGSPHPAPLARLDRQFLIKLQGEKEEPRMATVNEIWQVHEFEKELGRSKPLIDRLCSAGLGGTEKQKAVFGELKKKGWEPVADSADTENEEETYIRRPSLSVDDLMSDAVNTVRLALKRHGDRARIAFGLKTDFKPMPGDQKYWFTEKHVDYLQDILLLWHDLAFGKKWKGDWSKNAWKGHIETLKGYSAPEEVADDLTGPQRKKKRQSNKDKLKSVAEELVNNGSLRMKLHTQWATKWREDDGNCTETEYKVSTIADKKISSDKTVLEAKGWYKRIRWLNCWITGHQKDMNIRNVGGLSLTRIATIKSLYQVQKAFFTRFTPEGRQMKDGKPTTAGEGFGQSILDTLERMRENRVKQLASRIAEAALGIGIEQENINKKNPKRPRERIDNPRFAPCHAVVIEKLTYYRPEETRTRRENRQLMDWSSSKVKKYLAEACELHGLHLREVTARYTSRQDSRTGAPGIRCEDVPVKEFLESPFWKKQIAQAEKEQKENKGDSRDKYILALKEKLANKKESTCSIRIPQKSGDIFVSANGNSSASKGIQADLNAAANIGLKALLDPDWPGKWWYVPCDSKEFKPVADKVKGSAVFQEITPLKSVAIKDNQEDSKSISKKKGRKKDKSKEVVNLWRDPSAAADGEWSSTPEYWNHVQSRVIKNLRKEAGIDPEDIPF